MLDSTQSSDGVITKPSSKSVAQTIDGLRRVIADRGFTVFNVIDHSGVAERAWFTALIKDDLASAIQVAQAVAALREEGPALGRPLVDRIQGSRIHHLKELRPGSAARSEIRVLFAFDPTRSALLLLGGDKAGNWRRWYKENIPVAEQLYLDYTTEGEE
jgi:hypothetical protein